MEVLEVDIHLGGFSGGGRSSGSHSSGFDGGDFDGPRPRIGGYYVSYSYSGIVEVVAIAISLIVMIFVTIGIASMTNMTTTRVALSGVVNKTEWYEDNIGIITKKSQLKKGLKTFYNETGVQPYILLIQYSSNYWKGTTFNQTTGEKYLENYYNDKFTDEGHLIFAYFASEDDDKGSLNGKFLLYIGTIAKTVIDSDAEETLMTYFNSNYKDKTLKLEKVISTTFSETAENIMPNTIKTSDIVKIIILLIEIVLIVFVVFIIIKRKIKKINIEKTEILDSINQKE